MVVGLAFKVKDQFAHIEVMQGKIGLTGDIVANSTSLIGLERIGLNWETSDVEYGVFKKQLSYFSDGDERLVEDKDFAVLSWDAKRFNLDTISLPQGNVVTGKIFNLAEI